MHVLAFLLTVVGVALSLVYSDVFAMIAARGADLSWLKDLASLDAKTLCVLGSSALAVLGALFALCKKRFGSLLLLAAAGVCLYCEFKLGIAYPYVRAAAGLFGAAAVFGWFRRRDEDEEDDEQEWNGVAAPVQDKEAPAVLTEQTAAPSVAAAAEPAPAAEEPAAPAPLDEAAFEKDEPAAPVEAAAAEDEEDDEDKPSRFSFWSLLFALAAAAFALYMSGVWETAASHGKDLSWLKDFASFDLKTKVALGMAGLSVLGGVFAFFRGSLGGLLLFVAAVAGAVTEFRAGSLYTYSWGAPALCLLAAVVAWSASGSSSKGSRRYTSAYVYACIFGLAAAALALYMSGLGCSLAAKGTSVDLASEFAVLDCKGQSIFAISAAAIVGAVLALLGARFSVWLLLAAMLGSLAAEMAWTPFYSYSWVTILLLALASMLAGAFISTSDKKAAPAKRLTLHGAFVTAVFAAVVGAALMWSYNQSRLAETLSNARENDPAYRQLNGELKSRDAAIAEMNGKVQEQVGFVAERDKKILDLTAQATAKDSEIAALTKQNADRDAQIAALNSQLEEVKSKLQDAQAAVNKKFVYMRGSTNVRTVPNSDKGSKVIGRLTDAVVEVLDTQRPAGSSANWYKVKYGSGTGWVFGKNGIVLNLHK